MLLFRILQGALICASLVAGLASLCHMIIYEKWRCKNSVHVGALILAGMFHVVNCVALLNEQEQGYMLRNLQSTWYCIDYFAPATYFNAFVLVTICYLLINRTHDLDGSDWGYMSALMKKIILLTCVPFGVVCAIMKSDKSAFEQGESLLLTLGVQEDAHVNAYMTVCRVEVAREWCRLLFEYLLVYLPVLVLVGSSMYAALTMTTKDISLWDLQVLASDNCRRHDNDGCRCKKLNQTLISILVYAAVFLLLARPAQLLYAHVTSGFFYDVIPCLLQTTLYCSLCCDYIWKIMFPFYATTSQ